MSKQYTYSDEGGFSYSDMAHIETRFLVTKVSVEHVGNNHRSVVHAAWLNTLLLSQLVFESAQYQG